MKDQYSFTDGRIRFARFGLRAARLGTSAMTLCIASFIGTANAYTFETPPDYNLSWNNTVRYTIGTRLEDIDPAIGNNPTYDEGDYKFSDKYDIVTNRASILSELSGSYKGKYGFKLSGTAFKDAAYDDDVQYHPGNVAPGVAYSDLNSYKDSEYSNRTEDLYVDDANILDAYVFGNFFLGDHATSVRVGQMNRFWGEAFFFARQAISYSQNSADFVKQVGAPGTTAKQLTVPRTQVDVKFAITPALDFEFQHFLEDDQDLLIQGGTFLGGADPLFQGPEFINGAIPHGRARKDTDWGSDDFGLRLAWTPLWLRGTVAAYYRHYTEVEPWALLFRANDAGNLEYFQSYNDDVDSFGLSLSRQFGTVSTGFEVSYRDGGALPTTANPAQPSETGARGNTINVIANAIVPLSRSLFWDTGTAIVELGYTYLDKVTDNKAMFNSVDNPATCPSGNVLAGCATDNQLGAAASFTPQWLQVLPGVDLSMPLFALYGIHGNAPALGVFAREKSIFYTAGFSTNIYNKYRVSLTYHGAHYPKFGGSTTFQNAGGPRYAAGGNGFFFYNDKDYLSLTFETDF